VRAGGSASADPPPGNDAPVVADLDGDTALNAPLATKGVKIADIFGVASKKTGKAFVVLGKVKIPVQQVDALNEQPVRNFLTAVSDATGSRWRRYRDFYLLYPAGMERHAAKPVRRDKLYPELDTKIVGAFDGETFNLALERLGAAHRLHLLV